ncbi:MAG: hypothetical protein U0414_41275 [Polyangiaceae bacterium]
MTSGEPGRELGRLTYRLAHRSLARRAARTALELLPSLVTLELCVLSSVRRVPDALIGFALIVGWGALPLTSLIPPLKRASRFVVRPSGVDLLDDRGALVGRFEPRDVEAAHYVPGIPPSVEIRARDGRVLDVAVPDEALAKVLLDGVGQGASHRRSAATAGPVLGAVLGVVLAGLATAIGTVVIPHLPTHVPAINIGFVFLPWLGGYAIGKFFPRARVTVGADGILVRPRLGATVALRFTDIEDVSVGEWLHRPALLITTLDGRRISVGLGRQTVAMEARIKEAMAEAGADKIATTALELDSRSASAARERLRSALQASYRGVALTPDELLRALSDPSTPPRRRVAAAWAIGLSQQTDARARARVVAEQLTERRVRVLVDKAIDDRIADAELAELEEQAALEARGAG